MLVQAFQIIQIPVSHGHSLERVHIERESERWGYSYFVVIQFGYSIMDWIPEPRESKGKWKPNPHSHAFQSSTPNSKPIQCYHLNSSETLFQNFVFLTVKYYNILVGWEQRLSVPRESYSISYESGKTCDALLSESFLFHSSGKYSRESSDTLSNIIQTNELQR